MNDNTARPRPHAQDLVVHSVTGGTMADAVRQRPELADRLAAVIALAGKVATTPIVTRVYRYADIGKDRAWLDGRAKFMDDQPRQEWFGLAMSDFAACSTILTELPLLAFAYRCTDDDGFRARVISQLEETATWSPLQRPGWSLCIPSPDPVPAGYWDGSWLATGTGVRALADTLELLPEGSLPPELMDKLRTLLRAEIETITDDWKLQRGWFRGGNGVPQTNQWVLPTEGLIRACLVLGKNRFPAEYELGVSNLLRALDVQGRQGEFNEGIHYAMFTVTSMLATAHAMDAQGDARAIEHPFLRGFPTWAVHHLQPGRLRVNCFDASDARTPRNDAGKNDHIGGDFVLDFSTRPLLEALVVFARNPTASWALNNLFDGPTDSLAGLLARTHTPPVEEPPCFAFYDGPARRVNWRSSWDDDADGVWVRGGHPADGHDHFDRGHVNYIVRGVPLLIEAGTPGYDNPVLPTLYATVVGHNVLEVEGITPEKAPAPIRVARLDAHGGDITLDGTACYPGLAQWQRRVTWDHSRLVVEDQVEAPADKPAVMLFRWHLGTDQPPAISGDGGNWQVVWPDGSLTLTSCVPLTFTQANLPDNTVCLGRKENGWDFMHTCIIVRTVRTVPSANVTTTIRAAR